MGCVSAKVERIAESPKVAITKDGACEVEITGIVSAIKAFVTYLHSLIISITCNRIPLNVEVSHTNNMDVSVSLVAMLEDMVMLILPIMAILGGLFQKGMIVTELMIPSSRTVSISIP